MRKLLLGLWMAGSLLSAQAQRYETINVEAPFKMDAIKVFQFPQKDFNIKRYGAVEGNKTKNMKACAAASAACNKAGGGRVVVPAGNWLTGPIHLKSKVNLHLEEGAVVKFSDDPQDYLPAVQTSWEGTECYNYSPLVYAFGCEDIAITGKGRLEPKMDTWKVWFKRPQPHIDAIRQLYVMGATDVPMEERQLAKGQNNLRPHLIHFNRCKNVLLDGFQIRNSPFWTIHMMLCEGGVIRNLDVKAHGHNNDGVDIEMSRNFLIENCTFDQGDDAICIKSGRNRDAWRLDKPSENIVIRYCDIKKGHSLLGIGSELSGGIRKVYMHDCKSPQDVLMVVQIKTSERRGGFVDSIFVDRLEAKDARRVVSIYTDVLYQMRKIVPTFEKRLTKISNIFINDVKTANTDVIYELLGDEQQPIRNVRLSNIRVGKVNKFLNATQNVVDLQVDNITHTGYEPQEKIVLYKDH